MKSGDMTKSAGWNKAQSGFTLVELLIAMTVTVLLGAAMVTNYISQERTSTITRQVAQMQQQLRGAMFIMEQDIRIAGYTPNRAAGFGVTNVQRWSITVDNNVSIPSADGSPSLRVAYDWGGSGIYDDDGIPNEPQPAYRLFDDGGDGIFDLTLDNVTLNRQLVAEGIEAIGFAYAFDANGDGNLDRSGGNIIWAVDSDNDNKLDTNLDTNGDGVIDLKDDKNDDRFITPLDGGGLATPVLVRNIRMVRIWLLARARTASVDFSNTNQYIQVGDQIVPNRDGGFNDSIRRRLLVRTVQCRNAGL